jgi:hypothetical protein
VVDKRLMRRWDADVKMFNRLDYFFTVTVSFQLIVLMARSKILNEVTPIEDSIK